MDFLEDRTGLVKPITHAMLHPVPRKATWAYVFGTAIMTCFIVQLASGVALSTMYVPSGGEAWESVKWITEKVPFGAWLRATHYFGASAMIIFVGVHAMQTYLYGSFKFPRELNWISGRFLAFSHSRYRLYRSGFALGPDRCLDYRRRRRASAARTSRW